VLVAQLALDELLHAAAGCAQVVSLKGWENRRPPLTSAVGTKPTWRCSRDMSVVEGQADVARKLSDFRN